MLSIDTVWHDFVGKLEQLRHKLDPKFHNDLDELGLHATKIKLAAEAVAKPEVEKAAETVVKDTAKAVVEEAAK